MANVTCKNGMNEGDKRLENLSSTDNETSFNFSPTNLKTDEERFHRNENGFTKFPVDPSLIKEEPHDEFDEHVNSKHKTNGFIHVDKSLIALDNADILKYASFKVEKDFDFADELCSTGDLANGNNHEIDAKVDNLSNSLPNPSKYVNGFGKSASKRSWGRIDEKGNSKSHNSLDDENGGMPDGEYEMNEESLSMYITDTSFKDSVRAGQGEAKRKMVECKVCGKKLAQSYINVHMKIHMVGNKFMCEICNKGFKIKGSYNLHVKIHTEETPFACKECDKKYKRIDLLKTHMANVHDGYAPFKCDTCGKCFTSNYRLQRHVLIHAENKPYLCTECGQSFTQSHHLTDHMTRHTGIKAYKCEYCGKEFAVKGTLAKHIKIHDENKPYLCHHCGKNFYSSYNLKVHQRIHTGEKPYVCEVCGKGFTGSGYLKEHIAAVHLEFAKEAKQKTYQCSVCEKSFSSKYKLSRHVRSHTGEKPHVCDVCGKGYSQKGHLNDHLLTHTNNYPFKCDLCGQGYKSASKLEIHTVKHMTSKSFQCKKCGEVFSTKEEKFNHNQEFHSHEFKFQCPDCPQMFRSSRELETHAVTHTGIRPYPCTFEGCDKRFTQTSSLNMHLKRHESEKKFKCEVCGMSFYQKGCLKKHSLTHSKLGYKGKECDICGTFYKDYLALQYHMKIHEGEYLFDCDKCMKSFNSKENLEKHKMTRCGENYSIQTEHAEMPSIHDIHVAAFSDNESSSLD